MSFFSKLKTCGFNIDKLRNARILITGATGLIGKTVALNLINLSDEYDLGIQLILIVRDENKLDDNLKRLIGSGIKIVKCDILGFIDKDFDIDFIIHGASITSSMLMIKNPVEVILTNIIGTKNILEFAKRNKVKSVVYLSSMEIYGFSTEEIKLTEDKIQYLNPISVRSSYPESKRMAENLCVSYFNEYSVPVKIIRLAQTFGKGVNYNDTRVFAEFARNAVHKKDIVLLTDGKSKRMYLDVEDAVTGIITVLFKGENGSAYNLANKETYCSISEMAQLVVNTIGENKISVKYLSDSEKANCFSPVHKFYLDVTKIEMLGWHACTSLEEMYREMIAGWVNSD